MLNGIKKGLSMMAQALSMRVRAETSGNSACQDALNEVFAMWFQEATGALIGAKAADVKIGLGNLLFGDPFVGSRQAFRAVQQQFPGI